MTKDWSQVGELVLHELKRLNTAVEKHITQERAWQLEVNEQLATLKVKAGIWGALSGAVPATLVLIYHALKH